MSPCAAAGRPQSHERRASDTFVVHWQVHRRQESDYEPCDPLLAWLRPAERHHGAQA